MQPEHWTLDHTLTENGAHDFALSTGTPTAAPDGLSDALDTFVSKVDSFGVIKGRRHTDSKHRSDCEQLLRQMRTADADSRWGRQMRTADADGRWGTANADGKCGQQMRTANADSRWGQQMRTADGDSRCRQQMRTADADAFADGR
jgi:hypothetical protein